MINAVRFGRVRFAIGLGLVAVMLAPNLALGHAELDTITPADKSRGPAPAEIVGTFVQNLDPKKSSFTVVAADGTVVATGGDVDPAKPRTMTLTLPPLDAGPYTVRWTTVSTEDGELDRGITTFTVVAAPSPSPTPSPSPASSDRPQPSSSVTPSVVPSVAPTVTPSTPPTTPAASTGDAIIPIVAVLIVLVGLALWLLRGRSRVAR